MRPPGVRACYFYEKARGGKANGASRLFCPGDLRGAKEFASGFSDATSGDERERWRLPRCSRNEIDRSLLAEDRHVYYLKRNGGAALKPQNERAWAKSGLDVEAFHSS